MAADQKKTPASKRPAGRKVEKENTVAWWCPVCDTSNAVLEVKCGGCGAERDGDQVKPVVS